MTVFLHSRGKIAVLRRSDRVGTYRCAWAGVSGYVERLPLAQARVEIEEETGLRREQVALEGIGIPQLIFDEPKGRTWLVHPFIFDVPDPGAVRIDWEAEEMRWIEPDELSSLETVPGLDRALAAVWPPVTDRALWDALASVALDTRRGATSLAGAALQAAEEFVSRGGSLMTAARALAGCRPSMGVFPHFAARVIQGATPAALVAQMEEATAASADVAAEALTSAGHILTISHSSAVLRTLLRLQETGGKMRVTVAESRPGLEGVTLAENLTAKGIPVEVITDAQVGTAAAEADCVLVGCDAITSRDEVRNKAGTLPMALAAKSAQTRCVAVSQSFKVTPPGFPDVSELQEPEAVGQSEGVVFRNRVFDETPLALFDAVYTENGALTARLLSELRKSLGAAGLF